MEQALLTEELVSNSSVEDRKQCLGLWTKCYLGRECYPEKSTPKFTPSHHDLKVSCKYVWILQSSIAWGRDYCSSCGPKWPHRSPSNCRSLNHRLTWSVKKKPGIGGRLYWLIEVISTIWLGKSGKSSINGPFSMAMLNNQRVYQFGASVMAVMAMDFVSSNMFKPPIMILY